MINPPFQLVWFNVLAFELCMTGVWGTWKSDTNISLHYSFRVGSTTNTVTVYDQGASGVAICVNSDCLRYPYIDSFKRDTCEINFDTNDDNDIDLKDWANLINKIAHCDGGRCLLMKDN
jgi:hypothetical protein